MPRRRCLRRLRAVLDVPEVAVELMAPGEFGEFGGSTNAPECIASDIYIVCECDRIAAEYGLDRALVDVARGRFAPLGFGLADGDAAIWERAERVRRADTPGAAVVVM